MKIKEKLIQIITSNKDKNFISNEQNSYTYLEIFSIALSYSEDLNIAGIRKGDVIIFSLPNSINHLIVYLACLMKGYIAAPVYFKKTIYANTLKKNLRRNFKTHILKENQKLSFSSKSKYNLNEILSALNLIDEEDFLTIHQTSGTTGNPKIFAHTVRNIFFNAICFSESIDIKKFRNFGHFMPMYYMAGFLNCFILPLVCECEITVLEEFNSKVALNFWNYVEKFKIDSLWLSPTMIEMIRFFDRGNVGINYCYKNDILFFSATSALLDKTRNLFENKYKVNIINTYGLTETLFISTCDIDGRAKGSVGKIIKNIEFKLANLIKDKKLVSTGELLIKTNSLGYRVDKFTNQKEFNNEKEFFSTGDIVSIDKSNFLFFKDRLKDIIIKGGINYSPIEIEKIINKISSVKESTIIGQPDDIFGEKIVAFVVLLDDKVSDFIERKIQSEIFAKLGYKVDKIILINKLPRNNIGKIDKIILKNNF